MAACACGCGTEVRRTWARGHHLRKNLGKSCSVEGCDEPAKARGWCYAHHYRWLHHGDVDAHRPVMGRAPRVCSIDGCGRAHRNKGFCRLHHHRFHRYGDPLAGPPIGAKRQRKICNVDGCEKFVIARGYCGAHHRRFKLYGDPLSYSPTAPQAHWFTAPDGYVYWSGRESRLQHRVVMEEMLGRPLRKGETVHHKNGVRHDNRPENLELWAKIHPAGQRVTDLVAFAREVLDVYARDADHLADASAPP